MSKVVKGLLVMGVGVLGCWALTGVVGDEVEDEEPPLMVFTPFAAPDVAKSSSKIRELRTFHLDPHKSKITFRSKTPLEQIRGTANRGLNGQVTIDLADLSETTGTLRFPVRSFRTGNLIRDRHLAGEDWLNARENPDVIFHVTSLEEAPVEVLESEVLKASAPQILKKSGVAVGQVEINGVEVAFRTRVVLKIREDRGIFKVEFEEMSVKLSDHNIAGPEGVVGHTVSPTITIKGVVYGRMEPLPQM